MAQQVSQATFDEAVKENVQEFEMSIEEAINDAVQQFESQGVNLGMILRDATLYTAEGVKLEHPVITALKALSLSADSNNAGADNSGHLDTVKQECDIELSRRCFVGKNDGYQTLLKALKNYRTSDNKDMFVKTLETLCSLCTGQPDLLTQDGAELFMDILKDSSNDQRTTEVIVKLVRLNCTKHEMNRQTFVKLDLIKALVDVLTINKASASIVKEVAYGLRVLTHDDDIRVEFGSAHENAKQIVIEGNALQQLLEICKNFTSDTAVQAELFSTLGKLVVRNEFCKEVMDLGGLDLILDSFQTNIQHKDIVKQAVSVLQALAGNDDIKIAIVKAGGIPLILAAITQHQGIASIAALGCKCLATLVLRKPDHCPLVIANNGHHVILQAMKIHPTDESVQKNGCMAVRNIVARTRDLCGAFLELGAEELVRRASTVAGCEDEAKAALRDLDCQVDLKCRWTGEKGGLSQTAYA